MFPEPNLIFVEIILFKSMSCVRKIDSNCGMFPKHLTRFNAMFHFYTPRKREKTFGFLTVSGVIEMEHWAKMS